MTTSAILDEEENGLRLRLVIEKAEDVLRNKFHQYFPVNPTDLYKELSNKKNTKEIQKLVKKKILHQEQIDLLLPASGQTESSEFDLTLLTLLLRSLCNLKAPVTGWADTPLQSDQSDSANLVRIRIGRNKLQHEKLKYREPDFTYMWDEICDPLIALGCNKKELLDMKTVSLDPITHQQLHQIQNQLKITMQKVSDLEDSLDGVTYNLLPTSPSFVGRTETIKEIHSELVTMDDQKVALVISGLGGVGKTEIVREYCQKFITHYKNNVIWINAEQEYSIRNDFINVAEQINLSIKDDHGKYIGIKPIIAKVYNFFAGRPVLFVFDNIIENNNIFDIIHCSNLSQPSFILTTQLTTWSQRFKLKKIDVLSRESAFKFIKNELTDKHTLNVDYIREICDKVQCFPLALQQAVAYIKQGAMTIAEYMEEFDMHKEYILSHTHGDEAYKKTIATTWRMALQKIREHEDSSFIISFLGMLSYLDGKGINKKLFTAGPDKLSFTKAIVVLQKYSLISVFTSNEDLEQIIQIHSLVQMIARIELGSESQTYLKQLLQIIFSEKVNTKNTKNFKYGLNWWNHLVYIFMTEKSNEVVVAKLYENMDFLFDIADARGQWQLFAEMLSISNEMKNKALKSPMDYYEGQTAIALCMQKQGKYDVALRMYLDNEKSMLDLVEPDHSKVLILQNNLAFCLHEQGKYDLALQKYLFIEKSLERYGPKYPALLVLQSNIALCLQYQGNYDLALKKYMEIEKSTLEVFGPEDLHLFTVQNNIAACYESQGNFDVALNKYLDVEGSILEIVGPKHPNSLLIQNNIALCLNKQGKYDKALKIFLDIEKSTLELLGPKHPQLLMVQNNIALCLQNQGNFDHALKIYLEIEKSSLETLGPKHPHSLILKNNIAFCLNNHGKYDKALKIFLEVEKSTLEMLGPKHPQLLMVQNNIALCHQNQGNVDYALKIYLEVEKCTLEILGPEHPHLFTTQNNIAACFEHQGHFNLALKKYLDVEKLTLETLGSKHPNLLMIQENIANCLERQGNFDMAIKKYLDVEKSKLEVFGPKHLESLITQKNIARCFECQGKFDVALKKYLEVEKSALEVFGLSHPNLLEIQNKIEVCSSKIADKSTNTNCHLL